MSHQELTLSDDELEEGITSKVRLKVLNGGVRIIKDGDFPIMGISIDRHPASPDDKPYGVCMTREQARELASLLREAAGE